MVTPWEFLSPGGPDSSTIVDLEEGKIIHVGFLFKDYDTSEAYEGSYDSPPMHEVWRNVDLAADFMLLPIAADLSTIAGTVSSLLRDYRTGVPLLKDLPGWFFGLRYLFGVSRKDVEPYGGLVIEAYRGDQPGGSAHTDAEGQYSLMSMPGEYTLRVRGGQGMEPSEVAGLTVRPGQQTNADFEVTPIKLPKILERSMAAYQSLRSYQDMTTVEIHTTRSGMDNRMTTPMQFAIERPNRLRLESIGMRMRDIAVVSDGIMLVTYQRMWNQYTQKNAPERLTADDKTITEQTRSMFVQKLIMSDDPLRALMEGVEEVEKVGHEKLSGIPTTIVELTKSPRLLRTGMLWQYQGIAGPGMDKPIKVQLWIGEKDFMIRQVAFEMDIRQMTEGMPEESRSWMEGLKIGFKERHNAIEIDPTFSEETFMFTPPEEAKLVEQFGPGVASRGMPSRDKSEFVGKPAPDFVLKDIDDNEVKLADFEGKAMIVNFWATWCGPCREEIPGFIALQSQYASKGFTMIGISTDRKRDVVRSFATENKINYPLLMADEKVREDYGDISAIPTTFVIDKKGIVRYTYVGVPSDKLIFQQKVEELLAE